MEHTITKFIRTIEVRSARMFRFTKEFVEWYRKEYHIHVDLSNRTLTPRDYFVYSLNINIYDEIEINEYDSEGRGHLLLRLVNSNMSKICEILGAILKACTFNNPSEIAVKVRELSSLLRIEVPDERKLLDLAFLDELLSKANEMMSGPTKFFDGASCYSIFGMIGTENYMDKLERNRFSLINDNEYKIAEAFFKYIEDKKYEEEERQESPLDRVSVHELDN